MAFDKKKLYTSPKVVTIFPKLVKPDTKFNKDGVYSSKFKFATKAEEEAFITFLTPLLEEAYAEECKAQKKKTIKRVNPWKPEVEKIKDDAGNVIEEKPTGMNVFTFKLNAQFKKKDGTIVHTKINFFDAGKPPKRITNVANLEIFGGSIIKATFTIRPYYSAKDNEAGVTLQIRDCQIVKLVSFGGRTAEQCGFTSEDEGYADDASSRPDDSSAPDPTDNSGGAPDPTDEDF